ncbi:conserved hypothetical protein [Candida dubliniensis CD36]|uniref:Uncharacterized protein n=1 Tax=Candida dubliniensis (strain CD36 / ATCC MYA-646 / CBS 7987 / NCPF 3949 / NRRL Y-17841) TaxID=573826 RepID=B9W8M1_CANDC|nr:conserved hypothetical protein [Candida dubliniensis CD36]CAX45094.1 conserved hypothetical protein [Candida dubliniensis CD36]
MNNMVSLSENFTNSFPRNITALNSQKRGMPLQETSPNIINKSPFKNQPGSVISSKKRVAASPVSLQRESVRLKINKPESASVDFDSPFGTTEAEIELNYRNWLLERRLQQANEMKDFLILEQEVSI